MKSNKKAFTLIELLVVIAIIGVLTTIAVVALNDARSKARDVKRTADIKQTQTALEMFFNDQGRYPTSTEWNSGSLFSTSSYGTTTYLSAIPTAPTPADGGCNNGYNTFAYSASPDGSSYTLGYCVGGNVGSLGVGQKCASPLGLSSVNCCGGDISYDGETYPTIKIGDQCWMAKNLNIGAQINVVNWATTQSGVQKFCFDNDPNNCLNEGGLYQWHTVMGFPSSCNTSVAFNSNGDGTYTGICGGTPYTIQVNHQGICPDGWHVPTDSEWHTLELGLSVPSNETNCSGTRNGAWGCTGAGTALQTGGNYDFSLTFPGYYASMGGHFMYQYLVNFWSSTPYNLYGRDAYYRFLGSPTVYTGSYLARVFRNYYLRADGFSLRCVKDETFQ
jgi:uncharacterized protein (TIGR02145 family)/prepilin-type N-terminal cleavage/methylation domain-containing protein